MIIDRQFNLFQVSLFIAAGYFLFGLLGQFMAVPPGFATLFWPASGLALGCCFIWGKRALPGIFLGSACINIYISYTLKTDFNFILPLFIASCAALQACIGVTLVRKFIGFPFAFHSPKKVLHFALLGGAVSSLVNSTLSCLGLLFSGVLEEQNLAVNWLNWWVGDALGVVLTIPWLLVLFPHLSKANLPHRGKLVLLLCIVSSVTALFSVVIASFEQKKQVAEFNRNADLLSQSMQSEVDSAVDILYSLKGLIISNPQLTPKQFQQYTRPILKREKGLQGLSWNTLVSEQQLASFTQRMTVFYEAEGIEYKVTEKNNKGELIDVQSRAQHVIVTFIEPLESNRKALGYDVYSQNVRQFALDQAADLRQEVVTRPITLLQEEASQAGVLIFLPVFSTATDQLMGYATAVLRVGDMAARALSNDYLANMGLILFDPVADSGEQLLFSLGHDGLPNKAFNHLLSGQVDPLQRNNTINIGLDQWVLIQSSSSSFIHQPWGVHLLIVCGLIISALFNWFIIIVYGQSYETEQQVLARTRELSKLNSLFNSAQKIGSIGHWEWDVGSGQLWWSDEVFHILEKDPKHFSPSYDSLIAAVHPEDRALLSRAVDGVFHKNEPYAIEHRLLLDNQQEKTVYEEGFATFDDQNNPVSMFGIIQDITGRKSAEKELDMERKRLAEIISGTNVGTWEWDIIGGDIVINERWAEILGYSLQDITPLNRVVWNMLIHKEDQALFERRLKETFSHSNDHYACEYRMRHRQGHWVWVVTRGKVIEWTAEDKPKRMSGTQADITERKGREEEIQRIAMTDTLTGLANRAYYNRRLNETINIAKRTSEPFALMMLDLDGFKAINDNYGHPVGDLVLKDFAELLCRTCREADVIARIGGDEFIVIMTLLEQDDGPQYLAKRILQQNDLPRVIDGHKLTLGVSIGIGVYATFTASEEALIKVADKALYEAKSAGKNIYKVLSV